MCHSEVEGYRVEFTDQRLAFHLRIPTNDTILVQPPDMLHILSRHPKLKIEFASQQETFSLEFRDGLSHMGRDFTIVIVPRARRESTSDNRSFGPGLR